MACLSETSVLAAGRRETSEFAVLVYWFRDPLHARIIADSIMHRVDKNDLIILVGQILVHPVRIEHTEVSALAAHTLLSDGAEVTSRLLLVDTLILWLSVNNALAVRSLASTTADSYTINDKALLSLVSESVSLLWAERSIDAVDFWKLAVLPSTDTEEKPHSVRLLLTPKLFNITVGTHSLCYCFNHEELWLSTFRDFC